MSSKYFLLFSFQLVLYQSEISLLLKASCFILLGAGNFNPKCNLGNPKCNLGNPKYWSYIANVLRGSEGNVLPCFYNQ